MHMKATISGKGLAAGLFIPEQEWRNLGDGLRLRIIARTRRKHIDADGNPFTPYSVAYARQKGGQSGFVGSVLRNRVDLTGVKAAKGARMLDNITVLTVSATTNPRVTLGFSLTGEDSPQERALYQMGEGRVDRLFFGLSEDDQDYGVAYIRKRLGVKT